MVDRAEPGASRFVFVSDAPPRHSGTAAGPHSRVGWRVVAANNRAIARSLQVYPSLDLCRAAVDELLLRASEAQSSVHFDSETGRWEWTVFLSGNAVAQCVRPYLRRLECIRALGQFLATLSAAAPTTRTVRHLGTHALQPDPDSSAPA